MTDTGCEHLRRETGGELPEQRGRASEDCLAEGSSWVHLRRCLSCGHVGCCDSSPRRHASAHASPEHPVVRSAERGEQWRWCCVDSEVAPR